MSCARSILLPLGVLFAGLLLGQQDAEQLPPDEDAALHAPKQYEFNPVQSKRELQVGLIYFKKGNYKAAAGRFAEATKWNQSNADAWLKLGEAEEKRGDEKAARAAYAQYLEVAPDAKNAPGIRKKLDRLK